MTNLSKRIASGFILIIIAFFFVTANSTYRNYMICGVLALSLREWIKISGKNHFLCLCGILYISSALLSWIVIPYNYIDACLILLITCTCDTFAYFGGKFFGGPKLAPKISPNKTISGAICGCIGSTIVSSYFVHCMNKCTISYCIGIFISSIVAILGDLLESKTKRILNIKDSGNLIPGHGGILDRLDSFLAVSNLWLIWYLLKHYVICI